MPGPSTRCTTSPTASRTRSSTSPTRSAHSSSSTTAPSTTGSSSRSTPYHPQQIEFARLNLSHTVMSKRKLRKLVEEGHVAGWDDPRMPTLSGLRRRGYTPRSIRSFTEGVGVARRENVIQLARLEHSVREDLNQRAPRVMAVLRPLRVVIENYPEDRVEELEAVNNPEDAGMGTRKVPFSRVLYIERDDFLEDPPKKFFRLAPGREVRLRYAYFITCVGVVKDEESGEIVELRCTYDPATRGGDAPDGRKVRGTLHWVSASHALQAESRLYDVLFTREDPDDVGEGEDLIASLNPRSLEILSDCRVEPSLAGASSRKSLSVREARLFLRRPGLGRGGPGLQPHRHPPRHLGQDREEVEGRARRAALTATPSDPSLRFRSLDRFAFEGGDRAIQLFAEHPHVLVEAFVKDREGDGVPEACGMPEERLAQQREREARTAQAPAKQRVAEYAPEQAQVARVQREVGVCEICAPRFSRKPRVRLPIAPERVELLEAGDDIPGRARRASSASERCSRMRTGSRLKSATSLPSSFMTGVKRGPWAGPGACRSWRRGSVLPG